METREFFKQRYNISNLSEADCELNYMDKFSIDSIGLIMLITDLEDHFGVKFSDEDFKDESFKTINGIEKMILRKKAG